MTQELPRGGQEPLPVRRGFTEVLSDVDPVEGRGFTEEEGAGSRKARENGSILFSPGSSFTGNSNTFLPPLPRRLPAYLSSMDCVQSGSRPAHSGNRSLTKIQSLN